MTPTTPVQLGPVQETLLIPLFGRAELTREGSALISDPKAVAIVESLEYDFSRFAGTMSALGSVFRTRMYDHWVATWLAEHPDGTVVEIGAGLNTRYERLDNGRARWIELDLPDVMELRRRFFSDTERRTMFTASITEDGWTAAVGETRGPCFVSVEAVLIYLTDDEVARFFATIADRFPGAVVAFDTWSTWMRDHQDEHDTIGALDASFTWFCDDLVADLRAWDRRLSLVESRTFPEAPAELLELLPEPILEMLPVLAADPQTTAYRQNLAAVEADWH